MAGTRPAYGRISRRSSARRRERIADSSSRCRSRTARFASSFACPESRLGQPSACAPPQMDLRRTTAFASRSTMETQAGPRAVSSIGPRARRASRRGRGTSPPSRRAAVASRSRSMASKRRVQPDGGVKAGYFGFESKQDSGLELRDIHLLPRDMEKIFNGSDLSGWKNVAFERPASERRPSSRREDVRRRWWR